MHSLDGLDEIDWLRISDVEESIQYLRLLSKIDGNKIRIVLGLDKDIDTQIISWQSSDALFNTNNKEFNIFDIINHI